MPHTRLLGVRSRYGLHTRAVTVFCDTPSEGFSYFVTSIAAPAGAFAGVRCAPTGKRRLVTADTPLQKACLPQLMASFWPACFLTASSHGTFAVCILGNYHRSDNGITAQRDEFGTEGLM